VADLFDVEDPIPGRYRLEVTSPGLDRPLESNGDFIRANGHVLKAKLKSGQVVKGRLVSSDDQQVLLETGTEVVIVPRIEIAKANIEPEF
jgi:ribosome maturation factor RimP